MKRQGANEGIIGNVTANVLAVGQGATAIQNQGAADTAALSGAIGDLRKAIDALALAPPAREALKDDLDALEKAGKGAEPKPDHIGGILQNLSGKLKMVGTVLAETTALAGPVGRIAEALRVPLSHLLG
ncbi:MAG: hypothetical protein JST11_00020 [Acidobacteria bacterium]|nr:hypothetical protein [Acidobacteriota bacterium]